MNYMVQKYFQQNTVTQLIKIFPVMKLEESASSSKRSATG